MWKLSPTPLITEEQIRKRVDELAREIANDLGTERPIVLAGLLRGCYVFVADLGRALHKYGIQVKELDFIICSSYGESMESSGILNIQRNVTIDLEGERMVLVDDIVDTGNTLQAIKQSLLDRGLEELRTVVLLDKPERRTTPVNADYIGFEIENHFVVGYGLDYAQRYRELPYIAIMVEDDDA